MSWPARLPHRSDRPRRHIRPGRAALVLVVSLLANLALAAGLAYVLFLRPPAPADRRPDAAPRPTAADEIEALGRVQPTDGVIAVFGPPGDRVVKLDVKLGTGVKQGERLAVLSGDEERRLGIDALKAQQKEAAALRKSIEAARDAKLADLTAEVAQAQAKADAELAALDAKIAVLGIQESRAVTEFGRLQSIESGGAPVPPQQMLEAKTLVDQVRAERQAAEEQKKLAAVQHEKAGEAAKAKEAVIRSEAARGLAQVPEDSLAASIKAAEQKAGAAELRAPVAGRVVRLDVAEGATLTNQPALQIGDTDRMSVVAEVYETNVPRLREWLARSDKVDVEVDARVLGADGAATLRGTVAAGQISPMVARNAVFALGPREDADRRVVEVEVRLDPASARQVAGLIGLQVRARFLPPGGR